MPGIHKRSLCGEKVVLTMKDGGSFVHFFLGSNTPQGFVSRFDQLGTPLDGWHKFVIKGGPGTGKSSLMKKVAQALQEAGDPLVEQIHCSSDPDSLDGVISNKFKISIADGTPPHVIEPKYPGAFESVVNLTDCWDEDRLQRDRREIVDLCAKNSACHDRCCRFLTAASSLIYDTYRIAVECTDPEKIARYARRLAAKEFRATDVDHGTEAVRFLSTITPQGLITYTDSVKTMCDRIYLIDDEWGAASRLLLHALRSSALSAKLDIISCYCPLSPYEKLEHLMIPSIGMAFITTNRYTNVVLEPYRRIHAKRFTDMTKLKIRKQRISFNRKAAREMLDEAIRLLVEAKNIHDDIERYYISSMDYAKVNTKVEETLSKIKSITEKGG